MKILVANHWLDKIGGSETFTYTLVGELVRQGHWVDLFTFRPGKVSERIRKDFVVGMDLRERYDLILANHNTTVNKLSRYGYTIQTCHGIFPKLEQPSPNAHYHVAVSEEVQKHLDGLGYQSEIIYNGIDQERFRPQAPVGEKPRNILSLVHSDQANWTVKRACRLIGSKLQALNKFKNAIWEVEKAINDADLVVSLGRGAYEAMSCARNVVVYDDRKYFSSSGDGFLTLPVLNESIRNNCSGRRYKIRFDDKTLAKEMMRHTKENADSLNWFAKNNLNISSQVKKYIQIYETRN